DGSLRTADTGATTSASRTAGLRRTTAGERRRIRSTLHGRGTASAAARRRRRSGNRLAGQNGLEVVVSNGILELLAQESLFAEPVDAGRVGVGELLPVQPNGAHVLLAAEDELLFLLASRHLLPGGHRDRHQDGRDAHSDKKCRHCVTKFLTCLLHGAKMLR